jgi:ATP-dependent Clp protease protease subunit
VGGKGKMTDKTKTGFSWIDASSERLNEYVLQSHKDRLENGEIWLNGPVDISLIEGGAMKMLSLAKKFNRITVFINSPGGTVDEGFAFIDLMMMLPIPIWTVNVGEAASMGLSVFLAGDRRFSLPHANFMAHSISYGKGNDKIDEQESYLQYVKLKQTQHAQYYASRSKKPVSWWLSKYKEADFYFGAEEGKKLGIVTDIIDTPELFAEVFHGVERVE